MTFWLNKLVPAIAAASLIAAPSVSHANTRAGGGGNYYAATSSAQAATFPYSAWFAKRDESSLAIWQWLVGVSAFFVMLSIAISDNSGPTSPGNQSNGAN